MPIPEEIRAVERPKNTIVIAYGKNKDRYAVRQRTGCRYDNGRRLPVNGPTIGHIIDGVYVPIDDKQPDKLSDSPTDLKDWAGAVLCDELFSDIKDELSAVYNKQDVLKMYCIAILRACNPGITDCELKEAYDTSFLSELYPDVALSKNTVSAFLSDLGKATSRIITFMKNRASKVSMDHHLLVDGTLKTNNSKVNSLSDFSRKTRKKGTQDISVLYAFDLEAMEPVCSKCYPGNMLDSTAYSDFISENGITKGIIVGDKGFPSGCAKEQFDLNSNLHYLNPIKRNAKLIKTHNMYEFTDILSGHEGITYRKEKCSGVEKWVYSFRDSYLASKEEKGWLEKAKKNGTYTYEELKRKQESFGTIVLECDLDLPAETVYKAYDSRWEIEVVMRYYKSACEFDVTRVHSDYSVIGSEFCDFLSTILTFKLIGEFDKVHLLDSFTYKKIMSVLERAKKIRRPDEEWQLIKMTAKHTEILQSLGLVDVEEKPKRKPGRPKGSKHKNESKAE